MRRRSSQHAGHRSVAKFSAIPPLDARLPKGVADGGSCSTCLIFLKSRSPGNVLRKWPVPGQCPGLVIRAENCTFGPRASQRMGACRWTRSSRMSITSGPAGRAISSASAITAGHAEESMIEDHPFAAGRQRWHCNSAPGTAQRFRRGAVRDTREPFVLPDPLPAAGSVGSARRLHVGCRRQALSRRLVRRHGQQYRPFQSPRAGSDAAADGEIHIRLSAAFSKPSRASSLPPRWPRSRPRAWRRCSSVSGGSEAVESAIKLARQYAVTVGQGNALEGDLARSELSRLHPRRAWR